MATKNVNKTRLLMKHDIEANWLKAENFVPLEGEIIVYDADETHSRPRMKIGDGETKVNNLLFTTLDIPDIPQTKLIYEETLTMEYMANTWITSGLIPLVVGNKYQVTIEDKTFSAVAVTGQWDADTSIAVLGNGSLYVSDMEDTGEPYCVLAAFNPIDVGGASLLGAVVIDGTVWSNKESVYLKIEEGSPNHLMLTTNENGEMVWEEKTHYEYIDYVVSETSYSLDDATEELEGLPVIVSSDIIEGNDYIVNYNSVEYKTNCIKFAGVSSDVLVMGNAGAFGKGEDNGLPFLFMFPVDLSILPDGIQGIFFPLDQLTGEEIDPTQVKGTYSIKGLTVKKLDPKFIDISVPEPDWNANEGEVGYIKNRTHGIGKYVEYFPEMEVQLVDLDGFAGYEMEKSYEEIQWIVPNKPFTITYDGVDYNCEFYMLDSLVGTGNLKIIGIPYGNNEPFVLIGQPSDNGVTIILASTDKKVGDTVTLKISNDMNRVMKLDKKFLPDGIFYMDNKPGGNLIAQCDSIPGLIDGGNTPLLYPLEEGRSYTINIGGDIFQSVCKVTDNFLGGEAPILYLGNLKQFNSTLPDSRESYVFVQNTERQEIGYYVNHVKYAGKTFTITLNEEYNKLPSKHLPTPNWDAGKTEEGYIENRTHYHKHGVTASWNGTTDGKAQAIVNVDGTSVVAYKFSDNFSLVNPKLLYKNKGKIVFPSSGNTGIIFPHAFNENGDFVAFFDLDAPQDGILSLSSANATLTMFDGQSGSISVPSAGFYYIKLSQDVATIEAFDVVIEDEIKTLDSMYIDKSTLGSVTIVSSDYEALVSGGTRIENPAYHMNFTNEEFVQLLKNNKVGDIKLYYTNSVNDNTGDVAFINGFTPIIISYDEDNLCGEIVLHSPTRADGKYAKITQYMHSNGVVDVEWLEKENSDIELDTTLKVSGKAADAKAVGDAIREAAFSGDYNDLTNKPTIPSVEGLATESYVQSQIMTEDRVNELIAAALANIRNGEEVSY